MGIVMENFDKKNDHWILKYGFEYTKNMVSSQEKTKGYERFYYHGEDNGYCAWVGISFEKRIVYLSNEYDCGGFCDVFDFECFPSNLDKDDEHGFIYWLDDIASDYIRKCDM